MRHRPLAAALPLLLFFSGAAFAQAPAAAPPALALGSTGAWATVTGTATGRPADTVTNDSAGGGNAGQPERPLLQGGGGR
ncbi:hypothetical protein QWZ18_24455 [Methylobacterium longum]|uniref:Uncharacterized protein n=1 Tax=Methylobacterium longum TaxID=767694 RepID=A0ABT8AV52_9HYPH|nr:MULTISPECIES: hypothetical protein [Methylobacterium]MCJ2100657.1 hypothetical protein [Methylobacterium sp. E-046]MDN3573756.1 hypothetical protein [Methylobacterium longum]